MYEEELVVPDIMTLQGEAVPNFATGEHTYMVVHEYDQKVFNTPDMSQIAGSCINALMPGATRSTFIWTAVYQMGSRPVDEERVWNLMQFFGGKAKDGQYHVATRWALDFGLGTPYKEVIESPEVQAAFSQWKDMKVATEQLETATTRDVAKTMWFPEWDWYMMGEVQDYIRGEQSTDEVVDKLHAKAVELKGLYPE
jgi:multiple sugar transport system substrate-binding protein